MLVVLTVYSVCRQADLTILRLPCCLPLSGMSWLPFNGKSAAAVVVVVVVVVAWGGLG